MRQERKIRYPGVFFSLMVVAGYVAGLSPQGTQAEEQPVAEAGKVAARVNGKPIYEEQLNAGVEKSLGAFRKYGMRKEDPALVRRLQEKALDKLIGDELVRQESEKLTVENVEEKVEQKLKGLERRYGAGEGMEKYLKMRNLTLEDVRDSFRARANLDEYLKEQGISEPEIPEDRIREMYEGDPDSYSREATVNVSHILSAVDVHAGDDGKKEARQEAERIHKEILEGKDFAEMAKEHSDCNSASGGGRLGYLKKGYMPEEFDKVAFSIEKDVVSEVVETKFGYHVIKVLDTKPAGVVPYKEVRDFIKKFLQEGESKKKLASHIVELKKKSKIEILLK